MAAGAALDPAFVLAELVRASGAAAPAQLPALAAGSQILATLIGRDGLGRTIVRTEFGQIALARLVDAPRGSVLTLEVHASGGRLVVGIRDVSAPAVGEGVRVAGARADPAAPGPPRVAAPAAPTVETPPRASFAVVAAVEAPVVRFAGAIAAPVTGTVQGRDRDGRILVRTNQGILVLTTSVPLDANAVVTIAAAGGGAPRLVRIAPESGAAPLSPSAPDAAHAAPAPGAPPTPAAAPRAANAPPTLVPASQAVVEAVIQPRGAADAPSLLPWLRPGASLVAVVLAADGEGRAAVSGPWGTLRLAGPAAPPPGTPVAVEVLDVGAGLFIELTPLARVPGPARPPTATAEPPARTGPAAPLAAPVPPAMPPPVAVDDVIDIGRWIAPPLAPPAPASVPAADTLERWPALAELVRAVARIAPEAAAHMIERLPTPDARLGPALARFAAVTVGGRAAATFGTALVDAALEAGAEPELRAFERDAERLAAPGQEPAGRSLTFPLLAPWGLVMGGLFVAGDGDGAAGDTAARRFIVELDLPVSGRVQFDGLVHGARLDLVVRTPGTLPAALGDALAAAFHAGCRSGGIDGAIRFQVTASTLAVRALAPGGAARHWTA